MPRVRVLHIVEPGPDNGYRARREELTAVLGEEGNWTLASYEHLARAKDVLVIRDAGLGDCLLITPALRAVKQEHPHLRIHYAIPPQYHDLLSTNPDVYSLHDCWDIDTTAFEELTPPLEVDLRQYCERHRMQALLDRASIFGRAFDLYIEDGRLMHVFRDGERETARANLAAMGWDETKPTVCVNMRGKYAHRSWPMGRVRAFCRKALAHGLNVVGLDRDARPAGEAGPGVIYREGRDLRSVGAMLAVSGCVVAPDTGIIHLAASVQEHSKPFLVGLYGAVAPELRMRWYIGRQWLTRSGELECVPCNDRPMRGCRNACTNISHDRVLQVVLAACGTNHKEAHHGIRSSVASA